MKNNKGLIIIVVIIVLALAQGEKKESSSGFRYEDTCLDRWVNLYQGCYTDCFEYTEILEDSCPLSGFDYGWFYYYYDDECDFSSTEQARVNCLDDYGVDVTYIEEPEGCTIPDADEEQFACRIGDVDQCINGVWEKVRDCSFWPGYTDSCATEPLISRSNEDAAVADCSEEDEPPTSTCTDTDDGEDFYNKGTVTADGIDYEDKCHTDGKLWEYFCSIGDPILPDGVTYHPYECTTGCSNGECIGDCTPLYWMPQKATICSETSFTQTSDCGTTRTATGTKDCPDDTGEDDDGDFDFNKIIPWIIGFFVVIIGIKVLGTKSSKG